MLVPKSIYPLPTTARTPKDAPTNRANHLSVRRPASSADLFAMRVTRAKSRATNPYRRECPRRPVATTPTPAARLVGPMRPRQCFCSRRAMPKPAAPPLALHPRYSLQHRPEPQRWWHQRSQYNAQDVKQFSVMLVVA